MSDNPTLKKKGDRDDDNSSPPAYDMNSFLDSDSDCEGPRSPGRSRKHHSPPIHVDPPAHSFSRQTDTIPMRAASPAKDLPIDTGANANESSTAISDSREEQRQYTPPSFLAKGRITFSRYSDLKSGVTLPEVEKVPVNTTDYKDPPSCNLDHFMDSDSDCETPAKPVTTRMPSLNTRVPVKHFSDSEPDVVSGIQPSSDSSEIDDLEILKRANDISEKCRVQGNGNGSVSILKKSTSIFREKDAIDSIPPARPKKIGSDNGDDDEDEDEVEDEEIGELLSRLGETSQKLIVDVDRGKLLYYRCYFNCNCNCYAIVIVLRVLH